MAGRIRSIKPEILDDEKTASLSHLDWRLFVSTWLLADDQGNLRGEASYVHGATLWASGESPETVARSLTRLAGSGLLTMYRHRGQTYAHITNWDRHQKVSHPGKPRMPGPNDEGSELLAYPPETLRRLSREPSGDPPETLATDHRSPTPITDPERDPRARAIPGVPAPAPVHVQAPDETTERRRLLGDRVLQRLNEIRAAIAPDAMPLPLQGQERRELMFRIREAGDEAEVRCEHYLAFVEAEARATRSVDFVGRNSLTEDGWTFVQNKLVRDAGRARNGAAPRVETRPLDSED